MPPDAHMADGSRDGEGHAARFTDLLASTIHDMKNSLGLVLNGLEELACQPAGEAEHKTLQSLQFEAKKLSNQLIQLLSFYKMSHAGLHAHCDEYEIEDLLVESLLREQPLLDAAGLAADLRVDGDLTWMLDRELILGVLGNAIGNAARHARSRLLLAAEVGGRGELRLVVQDDGPGFPAGILAQQGDADGGIRFDTGHTGLGLSFCALIAGLHRRQGRCGRIELANGGVLPGARFTLILP